MKDIQITIAYTYIALQIITILLFQMKVNISNNINYINQSMFNILL